MEKNEGPVFTTTGIYQKIAKVKQDCATLIKNKANDFFKSKYVTLDEIQTMIKPLELKHNIVVTHKYNEDEMLTSYVVDLDSGETIESQFPILKSDNPQKMGSAITYARRYNYTMLFDLITDDDDDGNGASEKPKNNKAPAKTEKQKPKHLTEKQLNRFFAIQKQYGWSNEDVQAILAKKGIKSRNDMDKKTYDGFIEYMEANPK